MNSKRNENEFLSGMICRIKHRCFTLIELLVVIAIIAILAGMLLPALSRAREMAKSAACTGNMKQVYTAISLYTGDYNNYLPLYYGVYPILRPKDQWTANLNMYWFGHLMGYLGVKTSPRIVLSRSNSKVFECPSGDYSKFAEDTTGKTGMAISYGPTLERYSSTSAPSVPIRGGFYSLEAYNSGSGSSTIGKRADKNYPDSVLIIEKNMTVNTGTCYIRGDDYSAPLYTLSDQSAGLRKKYGPSYRHNNRSNFLYMGGNIDNHKNFTRFKEGYWIIY